MAGMEVDYLGHLVEGLGYSSSGLERLPYVSASVTHIENFCLTKTATMT
jgi:hypothetical protein